MSWTRHFQAPSKQQKLQASMAMGQRSGPVDPTASSSNFSTFLPEVYAGHPQRLDRYVQYDLMDQDSEINAALDTIADFSTRPDETTGRLFDVEYLGRVDDSELEIIKSLLIQWTRLNKFNKRLWRIFRSTLKYGDQFFIRDPETLRLHWIDPSKVEKIIVNEAKGKEPEQYVIRDLDLNLKSLVATQPTKYGQNIQGDGTRTLQQTPDVRAPSTYNVTSGRFENQMNVTAVDATHIVHLSLSEGLDANWPFGTSILEPIFKVFKQKELLEDSIIIYRVQRAPERRVFYIDVGEMPVHKAQSYLEKVKMEIHQRRIPTRTGGSNNIVDTTYNPLSILEDFYFAQSSEGRGSRVDVLPGGENLGSIDDLKFFNNKLIRGLRVPSSYLPSGPDDGTASFNDGRVGTAYLQEYRFANYCQRLQELIVSELDDEFKLFIKQRGYNIDTSIFELKMYPPQNFRQFAQIERDAAQINIFQPISELKYISKRFALKRFLNLTEEEIAENERLWIEENGEASGINTDSSAGSAPGLDSVGFNTTPTEFDEFETGGSSDDFGSDSDDLGGDDQGGIDLGGEDEI